jgi:hypothetical protein
MLIIASSIHGNITGDIDIPIEVKREFNMTGRFDEARAAMDKFAQLNKPPTNIEIKR